MTQTEILKGIVTSFYGESCELLPASADLHRIRRAGPLRGLLPGKFRTAVQPDDLKEGGHVLPVPGDLVLYRQIDHDTALIEEVLRRRTVLSRKSAGRSYASQIVAVNADFLWIVMPADRPFSKSGLLRYLSFAGEIRCGLLLHKCDLLSDAGLKELKESFLEVLPAGLPLLETTIAEPRTVLQALDPVSSPQTFQAEAGPDFPVLAMTGPSGAGKTTILNLLLGTTERTGAISEATGKGKHTTVRRELIISESGFAILDTPGMRELGLDGSFGFGGEKSAGPFEQLESLAADCSFSDCTHTDEPGCALKAAVAEGRFDQLQLDRYISLKEEAEQVREFQKSRKKKKAGNIEKEAKRSQKEQWHKEITLKMRNMKKKR